MNRIGDAVLGQYAGTTYAEQYQIDQASRNELSRLEQYICGVVSALQALGAQRASMDVALRATAESQYQTLVLEFNYNTMSAIRRAKDIRKYLASRGTRYADPCGIYANDPEMDGIVAPMFVQPLPEPGFHRRSFVRFFTTMVPPGVPTGMTPPAGMPPPPPISPTTTLPTGPNTSASSAVTATGLVY